MSEPKLFTMNIEFTLDTWAFRDVWSPTDYKQIHHIPYSLLQYILDMAATISEKELEYITFGFKIYTVELRKDGTFTVYRNTLLLGIATITELTTTNCHYLEWLQNNLTDTQIY